MIVGEFDSLTVGMRVALLPGVAGARGGKVINLASSRFSTLLQDSLRASVLFILRVSPKA